MTSLIARLNPMVLIAIGVASLLGSLAVRDLSTGLITLGAYLVAVVLFVPRWVWATVSFAFCLVAGLSITYSTWRLGGRDIEVAVTAGLRIIVLAWPGSVAAGFIDPGRLGAHLARFLPGRGVAAFSASLQRFTTLADTWMILDRTRRARGFGPGRQPVAVLRFSAGMAFALIVHAMRDATRTAIAMDARGFADAQHRSWAEPAIWTRLDMMGLAMAVGLGTLPVMLLTR